MRRSAQWVVATVMGLMAVTPSGAATRRVGPAPVCVREIGSTGATRVTCSTWHRLDPWSRVATVVATTFHPAPTPNVVAYATWMSSRTSILALYPGYLGPGVTALSRGPEMVPPSARGRLLATFNSGFYEADAAAGFYTNHTLYFPMIRGLATVVRFTSGVVNVVSWSGGPRPGSNVVMARQNLALLVANGRPTALAANNAAWGLTLHGVAAVWRSALGVDAAGNLIYAAAAAQTSASLAAVMVELHCVRAMELDINPEWPIFVAYGGPGAAAPSLFVPNPNQIPSRFLYPSTKDFFALFQSTHPGEAQPW